MSVVCDAVPPSESPSGPQRSRSASMTPGRADKEKRKRSRVTPEQLVHLERFFAVDRSPTAARRKEISDLLGMQERQTQIWFQNRRAKAKQQDGKKCRGDSVKTPPDVPPELATGYEVELQNLLHEDEPVTIIPCTDLSVGTWRRIATNLGKHDLVAYLCETKRYISWFIQSSGYGFKMEIPFDIIVDTKFTNGAPGSGLASFTLSQPPTFYLDSFSPPHPDQDTEPVRHWKKCTDWTEDQQATKVLRHNLVGSAVQLAHVLRQLNAHISGSDVRLHSPGYRSHSQESSPTVLQEPSLSPPAFAGTGYYYHPQDSMDLCQPDHQTLTLKRSFSLLPHQQPPLPAESVHIAVTQPSSGMIAEHSASTYPQFPCYSTVEVNQSTPYSDASTPPHHISHSSLSANHGHPQSFSPHGSHQQPYSAGSVHSLPYVHENSLRPHGATPFGTPPLLTIPFYPTGSATNICIISPCDPPTPATSGVSSLDTNS